MDLVRTLVRKNRLERFLTSAFVADDPKGGGQDARNNPSFSAIYVDVSSINLDNASLAAIAIKICACSSAG